MLDWMTRVADTETERVYTKRPYALTLDGEAWSIVSDGRRLVAVLGESPFAAPETAEDRDKLLKAFAPLLVRPGESETVDLDPLREWSRREPCEECNGTGRVTCDECEGLGSSTCICPTCSDEHDSQCCEDGKQECDCRKPRLGYIRGVGINRNYLDVLTELPGATAQFTVGDTAITGRPHIFVGEGWIVAIMPVRHLDKDAPHLESPAPSNVGRHVEDAGSV